MKQVKRSVSLIFLASLSLGGPVEALDRPAEYPPASYTASQYVDSKGCVYVRAGFDGNINWVPRMARNRTPVCGFQPTKVSGTTGGPVVATARNVTVITAATPESGGAAAAPVQTAAAPAVRAPASRSAPVAAPVVQARRVAPAAAPVVVRPQPVVSGPARRPAQVAAAPVRIVAAPVVENRPVIVNPVRAPQAATRVTGGCAGLSPQAQQYMTMGRGQGDVRCGPQAEYTPYLNGQRPVAVQTAPRHAAAPGYAAPVHGAPGLPSYDARTPVSPAPQVFAVPKTKVVRQAPARVTTQAYVSPQARVVPRQVYENRLNQQGISVPKGYRPVWEDDRLNPYRAEQTLAGKRQMEQVWTQTVPRQAVPVQVVPQGHAPAPGYQARVSSSSPAPRIAAARSGMYIQVGSYRTPDNARATAQRLAAAGLPVQMRSSGTSQMVVAGPFGNDRDLGRALTAARRAGFADAFPRR